MSNRIIDFLSLGKGVELLQYINISEIETIQEFSNSVHVELDTTMYPISFYGINYPPIYGSIFDAIFKNDTEKMHFLLQTNQDRKIKHIYRKLNEPTVTINSITYSCPLLWNGLNALEVAILLENNEAISILRSYRRTMAHVIKPFSSVYGHVSLELAYKYNKQHVIQRLQNEINS